MNIEDYAYSKFINKNDIVYDIGAHIGEKSILFNKIGAKKIYAFEPVKYNYNILCNNTKEFNNIININYALHNIEYSCVTKFRHCNNFIHAQENITIEYKTIQTIINQYNMELPNFIKIDIEGMESIVLTTFDFLFTGIRPIIYIELHVADKNEPQRYENNPHWITPDEGGFDFNILKDNRYLIIDQSRALYDIATNWNPLPILHKGIILIPEEKYKEY